MNAGRIALAVVLSLVFPGFGQGLAERRVRLVVFAVADLLATLGVLLSVWGLVASLVVRLGAAIDAFFCARRASGEGTWGWAGVAVAIGGVGIVIANYTVEGYGIPSESMVPTLAVGDSVFVDKLTVKWRKPERGEVVLFTQPCAKKVFVKRVIALPGDSVEVRCGVVYVNDKAVEQSAGANGHFHETLGGHSYDVLEERRVVGQPDIHDFPQWDVMIPPSCVQGSFYDKPVNDQPQGKLVEGKPKASAGACEPQLHFVVPAKSFFVMGDNRTNANDSRFWGVVPDKALIGRVIGVYTPWSHFGGIR